MRIECHPLLAEEAVFLKARTAPGLEREFHHALDRLYKLPPGRERDAAFSAAHSALFQDWGLAAPIERVMAERPIIGREISLCVAGPAEAGEINAELFVRRPKGPPEPADRTLALRLPAAALLDPEPRFFPLRRDLLRIADMLDAEFGFRAPGFEGPLSHQNLQRDRLGVLWDIRIVSRLLAEGRARASDLESLRVPLARVFSLDPASDLSGSAFQRVLSEPSAGFAALLNWAQHPVSLLGPEASRSRAGAPGPGSACPLCGFPTCDWYPFEGGAGLEIASRIERGRPNWRAERGACRQCVELLEAQPSEGAASCA